MVVDFTIEHHHGATGRTLAVGWIATKWKGGRVNPTASSIQISLSSGLVLLKPIHPVQDICIGMAKNASDAAHASSRRGSLQEMFKIALQ